MPIALHHCLPFPVQFAVTYNAGLITGGWLTDYNEVGPHGSLGMRSPMRFYQEWKAKNGLNAVQN